MATIGQTEYPDGASGKEWGVDVADLPPGASVFWVSDGTETFQVAVEAQPGLVLIDAYPASAALAAHAPVIALTLAERLLLPGPLKVWNGTALVDAPLKLFDGSIVN